MRASLVEWKGRARSDPQTHQARGAPRHLSESEAKRGARPPQLSPDGRFFPPIESHLP